MNEELLKSVVELIDETLLEIDGLKKSNRFQASEITIEGPGEKTLAGSIEKKEDEKEEDEEDESEEDKKKKKLPFEKSEDEDEDDKDEEDEDMDVEKSMKFEESLKKSQSEMETLMKSYVDERITPIESKIDSLVTLIKELSDSPLPQRGATYKNVNPLKKTFDEVETLSKTQICDKLLEMKKSGAKVSSDDIISAELGSPDTLSKIVQKYNLN
jgi:hypothetical protein